MSTRAPTTIPHIAELTPWRRHLAALAIAFVAILLIFARDAAHLVTIWWTSSTFNHCLLIVPIIGWLVQQRAAVLATLTPNSWTPGLLLVGVGAASWLLGDAAGVSLLRHTGLIVILQGCTVALLGREVAHTLLFPLAYMLFLVPAGEELVPFLQGVTARLSMAMLGWTGIPAHMEGVFITTPGGYFEVAEACSGVKFVVAMLALGVLVAALGFRTWPRRIAFVVAALIVPVLANGVRAFATIYVASRTSAAAAGDFDHVVYGWFFFAIIIAALLGGAWQFFDRAADEDDLALVSANTGDAPALSLMLALCVGLAITPTIWSAAASANARSLDLPAFAAPQIAGWTLVERRGTPTWTPRFAGADRFSVKRYRDVRGAEVDLVVAVYAWQSEGRELVGFGQGATPPESGWSWSEALSPPANGRADRIVSGGVTREVLSFYRVGDVVTGNDAKVKLATLKARLQGGRQAGAAVLISSVPSNDADPRIALDAFTAALGPIDAFTARVTGG